MSPAIDIGLIYVALVLVNCLAAIRLWNINSYSMGVSMRDFIGNIWLIALVPFLIVLIYLVWVILED